MRILWHSAAPWLPTGYGAQTAIWTRYLRDAGHDVAISAYYGNPGWATEWDGMEVYPAPMEANVDALLVGHALRHKADVIVMLCDQWMLDPWKLAGPVPVIAWAPIDTEPMSLGDTNFLRNGPANIHALAMSQHGREMMTRAGVPAVGYIPHGIDTALFRPEVEREQLRAAFGIQPSTFAVGMAFNNIDPFRKAAPIQMHGFAEFHARHPDSVLFIHSMAQVRGSLDLEIVARTLGIVGAVRFADQYRMRAGDYDEVDMVRWYCSLDVLLNATCGEGFGIPAVEAQACGTPVILAANTTGNQLRGSSSYTVPTVPFYNPTHNAWWGLPIAGDIAKTLRRAMVARPDPRTRARARDFALPYDYRRIGPAWLEILSTVVV